MQSTKSQALESGTAKTIREVFESDRPLTNLFGLPSGRVSSQKLRNWRSAEENLTWRRPTHPHRKDTQSDSLRRSRKSSKRGRGDWESAEALESRQDTRRCPVRGNRVQSPETPRRSGNHERRHSQQSQAASGVAQRPDRVDRRRPPSGYEACQQGRCKQHRRSSHIRNPIERAHSVQQGARQPRCLDG